MPSGQAMGALLSKLLTALTLLPPQCRRCRKACARPTSAPPLVLAMPAISKVREIDLGVSGAIEKTSSMRETLLLRARWLHRPSVAKRKGSRSAEVVRRLFVAESRRFKANGSKSAGASLGCVAETTQCS